MTRNFALTAAMVLVTTTFAHAQLPSASTRALGMGDNFTAAAVGYSAVSWNPALLGLPGNPGASLALLPVRGIAGLDPVTLSDLKDFEDQFVPATVREAWLQSIEREGSEEGTGGGNVTFIAAQIGRLGVQVSTVARAISNLSPGAAEIILFGNAGRTGQPRDLQMNGSDVTAHAVSTLGLSYAVPIGKSETSYTAIGATAKFLLGHALLIGQDQGSTIAAQPNLNIQFPIVGTSTDEFDANGGSGLGLDIAFATRRGNLTIGAVVQNVINTFDWDETKLRFRPGTATFNSTTKVSNFDEQPFSAAPAALRELVDKAKYKPVIGAGVAYEPSARWTVTGDARVRAGDTTIEDEPKVHVGAGGEFRPASLVSLRAGGAVVTGGYELAGGVGLNLGPINLAASFATRLGDLGRDTITMFTVISTTPR